MWRIRKKPFGPHEDPIEHMVALLSREAEIAGTPLSDAERKILASEAAPARPVPEELRTRTTGLIERLLEKEKRQMSDGEGDPKTFGRSLEWAGDPHYPNIVALTEEVILSKRARAGRLQDHRQAWLKDRARLVFYSLLFVVLMLLFVVILARIFQRH
ncbi:MAG: hypothetical protein P4L00_14565 [Candidatus Acidoferrales bacterium]|nr:hypothetical protein [Candidatus Acidoferrales bacterium]